MGKYKVNLIGSGNVATNLAHAFYSNNIQIETIFSREYSNALKLANEVNSKAIHNLNELANADITFISVSDDSIPEIINQVNINTILVHTAGSVSIDTFKSKKINYGVFYPLQTFNKDSIIDFQQVPICLEASSEEILQKLTNIASLLSTKIYNINSNQRKQLHLAAVFVCNFINYLYEVGYEITRENSMDFELLRPLIERTAQKVQDNIPAKVQTGPAVRNDQKTIKKHLELLSCHPDWEEVYKTLSDNIIKYYNKQ